MRCDTQRWVEHIAAAEPDVVVVFGLGPHLEALAEQAKATVVGFPARGEHAPSGERAPRGLLYASGEVALRRLLAEALKPSQRVRVEAWPPALARDPRRYYAMVAAAQTGVALAITTQRTLDTRLERWIGHALLNLRGAVGRYALGDLAPALEGWPAIIVGAGPSLDRNIEQLRRAKSRARVIAVNSAVGALERAGVRADLIVSVELLDVSEQLDGLRVNDGVARALAMSAHPALHQTDAPVYPFFDQLDYFAALAERSGITPTVPAGGSVASSAFAIARICGAQPLIFVGQDLAYSTEHAYARGTGFDAMRVAVDEAAGVARFSGLAAKRRIGRSVPGADTTREITALEPVRAWGPDDGARVWSSLDFNYFRYTLESWAADARPGELYNATEGGARIAGFEERRLDELLDELPLRFDCGPLQPPPGRLPIDAQRLRDALAREHAGAAHVTLQAATAARSHHDADIADARSALACQPLSVAACRRPLVDTLGQPGHDFSDLFNAVAHNARRLARALRGVERRIAQPYGHDRK